MHVVCKVAYHARDKGQGACLVSHWDKFIASRKIPAEADIRGNCLSFSDGGLGLAFAIDGGLYKTEHISVSCTYLILLYYFSSLFLMRQTNHVVVLVFLHQRHQQSGDDTSLHVQDRSCLPLFRVQLHIVHSLNHHLQCIPRERNRCYQHNMSLT